MTLADKPMPRTLRRIVCAALLFCLAAVVPAAQAPVSKGFVWQVARDGRVGWVVGSLHVLEPDAYPLPDGMLRAFERATTLVEELDIAEMSSPATAMALAGRAFYTDGQTLQSELSPETYELVRKRIGDAGLPVEAFQRMKPWMIGLTLLALELKRGGFDPALGLDRYFYDRVKETGKAFVPLETALEQVEALESIGAEIQEELLRQQVDSAQTQLAQVRAIAQAWKAGDAATLERVALTPLKAWPRAYDLLIVRRNRAWLPKIETCLAAGRCFVVVGAGHVVGPEGLLAMLRTRGYSVEQQ